MTAAGAYAVGKAVVRLATFQRLRLEGNMICERGVEALEALLGRAGKVLDEMEENDDEGEDDLDDELEERPEGDSDELSAALGTLNIDKKQ